MGYPPDSRPSLGRRKGLIEEDGAEDGGADRADPRPDGVADTDVDALEGDAEEEQRAQEEDECGEGPGEVGEPPAPLDAQGIADLEGAREEQRGPRPDLALCSGVWGVWTT